MLSILGVDYPRLGLGLVLAAVISGAALRAGALSRGGAVAAVLVGGAVFGFGGPIWGGVLVSFFLSSSLLSASGPRPAAMAADYSKGSRRDLMQVLANGAVPAAISVARGASGNSLLLAGFVGAVAASTADTWATEVGLRSSVAPRMVTTGQPVRPGTSGAVTALGSAGAAAGGIFIGLVVAVLLATQSTLTGLGPDLTVARYLVIAPLAGLAGAALDSWLGATVQAVRCCPRCEKETERAIHSCGTPTRHVRGHRHIGGDVVNLLASLVGAAVGLAVDLIVFM